MEQFSRYECFQPSEDLRWLIDEIWVQEHLGPSGAEPTLILPTARIDLVLNFGDPFREIGRSASDRVIPACSIVGPRTRPFRVRCSGRTSLVIACLHPWASAALLQDEVRATKNHIPSAGELLGDAVEARLMDSVNASASAKLRVRQLETTLRSLFRRLEIDPLVPALLQHLETHSNPIRVHKLADDLGLSRRQLQRRLQRATGLTPKALLTNARSHRALGQLRRGRPDVEVAAHCGFSDQAHMVHELKRFSGRTPTALKRVSHPGLVQSFNREQLTRYL